jgi:hypothetical protein
MTNFAVLLIVGIICVCIAYYVSMPPGLKVVLNVIGWICVAVGALLLLLFLLNVPVNLGRP